MKRDKGPDELPPMPKGDDTEAGEHFASANKLVVGWHYYWGILDGRWTILRRRADKYAHPKNNLWDVRNNPPEGIEPTDLDAAGWD